MLGIKTGRQPQLDNTQEGPGGPYRTGELLIDYAERCVSVGGRPVPVTATEYDLLRALSVNAGQVSSYDYLLHRVWRARRRGTPRSVRAFVKKLRRKLGDDATRPRYIFSERGAGYRMPTPDNG